MKKVDYKDLYEKLYSLGYHRDGTNIGATETVKIHLNYNFDSILDIGCSQGLAVKDYLKRHKNAWGCDISPTAIRLAQEDGLEKRCVVGSILNIPFFDKSFDATASIHVIEHLDPLDIDQAISEIFRVTKRYIFLRISKPSDGKHDWLKNLKKVYPVKYKELDSLRLSKIAPASWAKKFKDKGSTLVEKMGELMVFEIE